MGTSIKRPKSNIGRLKALNKGKAKMDSVPAADNVLTVDTSARLTTAATDYNAGVNAIAAAALVYHNKVDLARPHRLLLKDNIDSYFTTMSSEIKLKHIPAAARAIYGLPISKDNLPDINTDDKLMAMGALVLSGDIVRRAAGGIPITTPTIADFTVVYNDAHTAISAISNALTTITNAKSALNRQNVLIDDVLKHVWDDATSTYSLVAPAPRRVLCRQWGALYQSKGVASIVTGVCTDSITHAFLFNVQIHIMGVGHRVESDIDGNYTINTILYDDLEIVAKLAGYEDLNIDFVKEDGIAKTVNVVMVKKIV